MTAKHIGRLIGVLCLFSLVLGPGVMAQQQGQTQPEAASNQQTPRANAEAQAASGASTVRGVLLFSDAIIGASVRNEQGEDIGDIQRLLINPQTGLVSYIEVSVGGFLGMGDKNVVVPWRALTASREGDALVLNISKQILQEAPDGGAGQGTAPEQQRQNQ